MPIFPPTGGGGGGGAYLWAVVDQVAGVVIDSHNLLSITDLGVGLTQFNFDTPASSSNYAILGTCSQGSGVQTYCFSYASAPAPSPTEFAVQAANGGGFATDDPRFSVAVFQ